VARGALRTILACYLNRPACELVFCTGRYGKPRLANRELRFNVSHSSRLALCAVSLKTDVGIDVEKVVPDLEELLSTRLLSQGPGALRARTFFQSWTRSEAYAKARGLGIWSVQRALEPPDSNCSQTRWWLHEFEPCQGYVAAVAARGGAQRLRYYKWEPHQLAVSSGSGARRIFYREVHNDNFGATSLSSQRSHRIRP
jgi:4'-phosphopantetheinyl transferase